MKTALYLLCVAIYTGTSIVLGMEAQKVGFSAPTAMFLGAAVWMATTVCLGVVLKSEE